MADEAFALSPISARAALPSEEDYEAISQAFMETSRGRWFLGEYAKRNRNADTRMVLDAVARIEETLAAQKQPPPITDCRRRWSRSAKRSTRRIRRRGGGRKPRGRRKSGADPQRRPDHPRNFLALAGNRRRRADLRSPGFPGQRDRKRLPANRPKPASALGAAFDLIKETIAEFDEGEPAAAQAVQQASPANDFEATVSMPAEAVVETTETTMVEADAVVSPAETLDASAEVAEMAADDATPEAADESREAAEPYDEALLDIVALEMAHRRPADIDDAELAAADEPMPWRRRRPNA